MQATAGRANNRSLKLAIQINAYLAICSFAEHEIIANFVIITTGEKC